MAETTAEQAVMMMSRIRYQVFTPEATTMGSCPRCRAVSRGAGACATCIASDLDDLLSGSGAYDVGSYYLAACLRQREAEDFVLRMARSAEKCNETP